MIKSIEIIERSEPFPAGFDQQCQEKNCKRQANEVLTFRTHAVTWIVWACTVDANALEMDILKAKAAVA